MTRRRRQGGFTLLEVMVASVLMGSVFVAVVSVMSQSLRNIDRMRPHEIAMQHARELMNDQLLRAELQAETAAGQWEDGYRWNLEIQPCDFQALGRNSQPAQPLVANAQNTQVGPGMLTLFRMRVVISWGDPRDPRTYQLETLQWAQWQVPKP